MKIKTTLALAISAVLLSACGGGSDSPAPAPAPVVVGPTAEGVYVGTSTGSKIPGFQMLILENGDLWTLYGTQTSTQFLVGGILQGTGTSSNGSFTSLDAKDFGGNPAIPGTFKATYDAIAKTISGTATANANTVTFNGGPSPGSLYNYTIAASLTNIAGSWVTTSTSGETVNVNIAAAGTFSAVGGSGCRFSGTVTPRASGKNVFDTKMTFGPAPCGLAGQTASGIAVSYPLATGKTQLILAQVDSTRTYGSAAFGTR
ncbi:hypothetical protein [Polaromonas sp. DSR2-3-2]|uniref:hypothetical protein n=1 Tax=unclassified Polaromonas TaxID=2638319 RepID=UPI003CF79E59